MPQPVKIVGNPCPVCQTLYIQGPSGVYCKPCYIQWKNSKDSQQPQPVPPVQNPPASTMQPIKPNYETEPFPSGEDKIKDNIRWCNALNNACLLVANGKIMSYQDHMSLSPEQYYQEKIKELANFIYNLEPNK